MPYQNVPDELQDTMERCVQHVVDGGEDKEAAIAICYTSVVKGEGRDNPLLAGFKFDAAKYGGRHSRTDRDDIRALRKMLREAHDLTVKLEPTDDDEKTEEKLTNAKASGLVMDGVIGGGGFIVGEVKAAGDWELDVLGVPFGSPQQKDSDGEYFTAETKTFDGQFPSPLAMYYHGFSPEGKPMGEPAIIGKVQKIWKDAKGWWYRVILDRANEFAKRIWDSAKQGKARASSGSIAHLVRKERDGKIINWPVVELSLIDAEGKRQPANPYAVALPAAQKNYKLAGLELPALTDGSEGQEAVKDQAASDAETETFIVIRGVKWKLT